MYFELINIMTLMDQSCFYPIMHAFFIVVYLLKAIYQLRGGGGGGGHMIFFLFLLEVGQ